MTVSKILGCASATNTRPRDEFYRTPCEVVAALCIAEGDRMPKELWEPFCGDGAIVRELELYNHLVLATDLNDRKVGQNRIDFLMEPRPLKKAIISNPPFNLADQIIMHALHLRIDYMALLLKADFPNSAKILRVFREWRPARIHALSWRPDFKNQGSPTMNCSWFIWETHSSLTIFDVLEKPLAERT